jgi:hypothetical protein
MSNLLDWSLRAHSAVDLHFLTDENQRQGSRSPKPFPSSPGLQCVLSSASSAAVRNSLRASSESTRPAMAARQAMRAFMNRGPDCLGQRSVRAIIASNGPVTIRYRRRSTQFKLRLCQDIRNGFIGRRDTSSPGVKATKRAAMLVALKDVGAEFVAVPWSEALWKYVTAGVCHRREGHEDRSQWRLSAPSSRLARSG